MEELKRLSRQLLAAKKSAQEAFLKSILSKEGKCWPEFYKYVKRRKGNRGNIPAIKDSHGRIITDPIEKANLFNSYYSTVFSCQGNISLMQGENTGEPFTIDVKIIRRRIRAIRKKKQISRARPRIWRNTKTGRGSHDSVPCATARYNTE
jgi:hypothetical protein